MHDRLHAMYHERRVNYCIKTNTSSRSFYALVLIMVRTLRLPPPWCIYTYMHDYSCYMTVLLHTD